MTASSPRRPFRRRRASAGTFAPAGLIACLAIHLAIPSSALGQGAEASGGSAPPVTLPRTEVRLLPSSQVVGVTYKLYVSLP